MKKLILYMICFFGALSFSMGQTPERFTILYLIPFESASYTPPYVKECEDMDVVMSYRLMGFWNGSQMALEEYNAAGVPLNVIVRDISNSDVKLRHLLEDKDLMKDVDLIIGPFFNKLFVIAAQYAKEYGIPIVNPFTSRQDVMAGNEYVYKLIPAREARPAMIAFMAQQTNSFPIILYGDSTSSDRDMQVFRNYFRENHVPYRIFSDASSVVSNIKPSKHQFVIAFCDNPAQNLIISRTLLYSEKTENLTFVVPESWLESKTYDIEYYSKLNLHFFSDYYIDYSGEKVKTFIYDYTQAYGVPPLLENFAFQGYDITRFFVEFLRNDKDFDRVNIVPTAFPLSFDKSPEGGYENVNVQFLEVKDNEIVPSFH
jgi:ABC-type branched-subunit amino acid transport system substrate-binding protein